MIIAGIVFLPFVLAVGLYFLGKGNPKRRDMIMLFSTAAEAALCLWLFSAGGSLSIPGILGDGLHFKATGFREVYAVVTAFMWLMTTLFSREYFLHEQEELDHYYAFVLMTLGATEGVMLSADLMTSFTFFEILSFTSFTWVIHEQTRDAVKAGYTYLFIAVIGGLVLFMGLVLLKHAAGTLSYDSLKAAVEASENKGSVLAGALCVLFGFGCKAGMFPVHVWLPKAHPVAPSPASALLSGILTKVGIYGILMTTLHAMADNRAYGLAVLLLGTVTMALGAVLALFSVNLKRTLACSSMSQIGFILTGIGMTVLLTEAGESEGIALAFGGTVLHMVNHSLIKLTLFMAAGAVVMNLGVLTLDDIRGWGRKKLFLKIAFALGALGISGVPMFNGYISKTLLHEGIVEGIHACAGLGIMLRLIEWIFLISGGLTFAYMLKLFICIFIEKNVSKQDAFDKDSSCMNITSTLVVTGSSLLMVILGQPGIMTRIAALMTGDQEILEFRAFTWTNLKGSMTSLIIGGLVYVYVVRRRMMQNDSYVNLWPEKLDLEDAVYRPVLTQWIPDFFGDLAALFGENRFLTPLAVKVMLALTFIGRVLSSSLDWVIVIIRRTVMREKPVVSRDRITRRSLPVVYEEVREADAPLFRSFSFALMMTCIGILLILGVLVYYNVIM